MESTYNQYSGNEHYQGQYQKYSPTNYSFNYNYNYMKYYNQHENNDASIHNNFLSANNTSISTPHSSSSYSYSNSFFNSTSNTPKSPNSSFSDQYSYNNDSFKSQQFNSQKSFNNQNAFLSPNYTQSITSPRSSMSNYQTVNYSSTFAPTPYHQTDELTSNNNHKSNIKEPIDLSRYNILNFYSESKLPITKAPKKSFKRPKVVKLDISQTNIGFGKVREDVLPSESSNAVSKSFQCSECPASFSIAAKLFMHQHKNHKNRSSTECPICYKKFNSPANALVHLRAHTQEKTYKCEQCGLAFCDSSTLKKHVRTHTGEKPYQCHLCYKSFAQSGNLKRHLAVHEKYDTIHSFVSRVNQIKSSESQSIEKNFECKSYPIQTSFIKH